MSPKKLSPLSSGPNLYEISTKCLGCIDFHAMFLADLTTYFVIYVICFEVKLSLTELESKSRL